MVDLMEVYARMSNEEREAEIYNQLQNNYLSLYSFLSDKINVDTNNYFSLGGINSITTLCELTTKVKSYVNNSATVPTKPKIRKKTDLYSQEYNIHNKIQYCNNILRYTLRKNGINFNNSNKMHELIGYLNLINCDTTFNDDALQNITLDNNGNLILDIFTGNTINQILVTDISLNNYNLNVTRELIDAQNKDNVVCGLRFDSNGNLEYDRAGELNE